MTQGKKHKRVAVGSTEEDLNTSKRVNMAASEDMQDYQELATEEPAITEIESTTTETSLEEPKKKFGRHQNEHCKYFSRK